MGAYSPIILGRNIKVISVDGQDELRNPEVGGRNITLDVHAIDVNGEEIDVEVQGNSKRELLYTTLTAM